MLTPQTEKSTIKQLVQKDEMDGVYFKGNYGEVNEKKYLINAKWWR